MIGGDALSRALTCRVLRRGRRAVRPRAPVLSAGDGRRVARRRRAFRRRSATTRARCRLRHRNRLPATRRARLRGARRGDRRADGAPRARPRGARRGRAIRALGAGRAHLRARGLRTGVALDRSARGSAEGGERARAGRAPRAVLELRPPATRSGRAVRSDLRAPCAWTRGLLGAARRAGRASGHGHRRDRRGGTVRGRRGEHV